MLFTKAFNYAGAKIATNVFNENFDVIKVDSPKLRDISFALRDQIFRVERGFDMETAKNGREWDHYDDHSLGFLVRHKPSETYIGTGRLITMNEADPMNSLPLQKYLSPETLAAYHLDDVQGVRKAAEISRLGILREYSNPRAKIYTDNASSMSSYLLQNRLCDLGKLGLYRAVFDFSLNETGTENCVFSTDKFLLNRFSKMGLQEYDVMEDDLDVFGPVVPVHFNVDRMVSRGEIETPVIWSILTDAGKILNKETGREKEAVH